jgi:hypothetical protein
MLRRRPCITMYHIVWPSFRWHERRRRILHPHAVMEVLGGIGAPARHRSCPESRVLAPFRGMRPTGHTNPDMILSPNRRDKSRRFRDTRSSAEYGRLGDPSRGPMAHQADGRRALAATPTPSYHGSIAEPHQLLRKASRRYIMKARLFTLALAVAPLAAMVGVIRSGR